MKTLSNMDTGYYTVDEIAKKLKISREDVVKIEFMALRKLKMSKKLWLYMKDRCDLNTWNIREDISERKSS